MNYFVLLAKLNLYFMKSTFTILFLLLFSVFLKAQDTIVVPSFNFKSSTKKDTMVSFPSESHKNFEKILLQYTMRCKNAKISTSANRNLGCGEWDYSCNTYLTDSTKTDSLKSLAPNLIIGGFKETLFPFVKKPTYNYTSFTQKEVSITSSTNEKLVQIGAGTEQIQHPFVANTKAAKTHYLILANEIPNSTNNRIDGIEIEIDAAIVTANFLKIKLKATSQTVLSAENIETSGFEEVYFTNANLDKKGFKRFMFNAPFQWNGTSNIVLELSYNNQNSIANSSTIGAMQTYSSAAFTTENDAYLELNGAANLTIPSDKMNVINKEITIGFWAFGNPTALPAQTVIFQAVDDKNQRQLSVHLPWTDSNIYWDCGGDANFDRINKVATPAEFEGKWNYWTFTKNVATQSMKIYLNGAVWHTGTAKTKPINIKKFFLGADENGANPYLGFMDDFSVWNKELDATTIKQLMRQKIKKSHQNYANLVCYYDFNESDNLSLTTKDVSDNQSVATFSSLPSRRIFQGRELFKQFDFDNKRPNIKLINGDYQKLITTKTILDSVQNAPYQIRTFYVEKNNLKESKALNYWLAGDFDILNEAGDVLTTKTIVEDSSLVIEDLEYFRRFPMKYELLSFVTPYGIGLDFGQNGKTWTFDITDFGPILNGKKRMTMERGGQNQEEMDIKFLFIKGKAPRDVLSISQIWPVSYPNHTSILSNNSYEPRDLVLSDETKAAKIKTAITGHGQEGEFIQQTHYINVNAGPRELEWKVWKECGDNPIFPQGGTWIYDRAGWCPGAATDIKELDITKIIAANKAISVDYGINGASGDSRYIVNSQLVTYSNPNFKNDAAVTKIIRPTTETEHGRFNPACMNPEIEIKNTGENALTSLTIMYGVKGSTQNVYEWKGNLLFLESARVILPSFALSDWSKSNIFTVNVSSPNGKTDEYSNNNALQSAFSQVKNWNSSIIISMRTNAAPTETSWALTDAAGTVIRSRKNGLVANTTYLDTIKNLNGCYQWKISDTGDDGISFWANSDGNGNIGIRNLGGPLTNLQPDFGREVNYQFTAGSIVSTNEELAYSPELLVYPNPTLGNFTVQLEGIREESQLNVIDLQGKIIFSQKIMADGEWHKELPLDLSDAPSGLYVIQIKSAKTLVSQRIVKIGSR